MDVPRKLEDYTREAFTEKWPEWFTKVTCGFHCPLGWGPLLWDACLSLDRLIERSSRDRSCLVVDQVKIKFGGLRFYITPQFRKDEDPNLFDSLYKVEYNAEGASYSICNKCGTTVGMHIPTKSGKCVPCESAPTEWAFIKDEHL